MNILHLKRHEIDDTAWNTSLKTAGNRRIYALTWYLDLVTQGQWNALVSDDYRYLFPLPFNKKIPGMLQVQRPFICQQLGLFGPEVDGKNLQEFLKKIPKQYRRINLSMNTACRLPGLKERTNLELPLDRDLATIRAGYSKSLRKRIRRAATDLRIEQTDDFSPILSIYRAEIGDRLGWSDATYQQVEQLLTGCLQRKRAAAYLVYNSLNEIVAGGYFLLGFGRVINVLGAANEVGKQQFATHFLLDAVIEAHFETCTIFDFEGSDLPGVADFFKSYGTERVPYYELEQDELPGVVRWLISLKHR